MPAAKSGPLPPNANSEYSRGSRPRSLDTARIARIMFDAAMTWAPYAASASGSPMRRAIVASKTSCARAAFSVTAPPASWPGFRKPRITLASVTVGSVPPRS